VITAATQLFVERGYAGTPLTAIARQAGVARPTVFAAFGSKAALLKEALDRALSGDDENVPVAERPWFSPVWAATDPADALQAYATVCAMIGKCRSSPSATSSRASSMSSARSSD
jgi:AcrR family transcriptional regulator